jgi:hypothetical protein
LVLVHAAAMWSSFKSSIWYHSFFFMMYQI